jgi:F0F1-type ATP synthase assembly protein I
MKLDLKTREQLRELNAQQWSDFKVQWPMHIFDLLVDFGGGTLLGVLLGLSLFLCVLQSLP